MKGRGINFLFTPGFEARAGGGGGAPSSEKKEAPVSHPGAFSIRIKVFSYRSLTIFIHHRD